MTEIEKKAEKYAEWLTIGIHSIPSTRIDEQTRANVFQYFASIRNNIELQKENEELKWEQKQILEDNDSYQKDNEELKAQIEQLKKQYKKQRNRRIDELQKENGELKKEIAEKNSVIEKMKCCENCKWNFIIGDYEPCNKCNDENDKWECVE